jgi:cobalamin biosynthesis protein CobD/CbiB
MSVKEEKKEEEKKPAVRLEEVGERIGKAVERFARATERSLKVFEAFSPRVAKGMILMSITIPSIILVGTAVASVAPYVSVYMQYMVPLIIQMVTMLMAVSIASLAIYMVRTFVFGRD